jgi:hypothetical protein
MSRTRTTYSFNDKEVDLAAQLRRSDTPEAAAVRVLTGYADLTHAPVSTLLRSIVEAGIQAIYAKAEEVRHEQMRVHLANDQEYQAWCSSRRSRRPRTRLMLNDEEVA